MVNRKERNGITRKERRERSLCVTLRKNFAHFAVKKISLFLIIVVGLENQFYLLFGISLREHGEQRGCHNRGTKKVKTTEIRE